MDMEFINILAGMGKERAEKHSKKYLDLMLQHGWKKGGDKIVKLEYMRWAQEERTRKSASKIVTTQPQLPACTELDFEFQNILLDDLISFRQKNPQFINLVTLSDTLRSRDKQAEELVSAWKGNTLSKTYPNPLHFAMQETISTAYTKYSKDQLMKSPFNLSESAAYSAEEFFKNPTSETAKAVFLFTALSKHMQGIAVDISGTAFGHNHEMKKALVEFLNRTGRYKMFLYLYNEKNKSYAAYTAETNTFRHYRVGKGFNLQEVEDMWKTLLRENIPNTTNSRWFIHVEKR